MSKSKITVLSAKAGSYIAMSNGFPITDGLGHTLMILSNEGDASKINELMRTARNLGFENLDYEFIPDVRPVSDEEYLVMQQRLEAGLDPDPNGISNSVEAYYKAKREGKR